MPATKTKSQRTIRMKKSMTGKKSKPRTEGQIFRACGPKGVDVQEVAEGLLEVEAEMLIDCVTDRDVVVKENKKYVDMLKKVLRAYAELTTTTERATGKSSMSIGSSTISEVGTATQLAALLKKIGRIDLFDSVCTVKIGDLKKYLGEEILIKEGFLKIKTNKYSKVSVKRLQ